MRTENKGVISSGVISVDGITINVEFHCLNCGVSVSTRVLWRQYREMETQWLVVHDHSEVDEPPDGNATMYKDSVGDWKLRYPASTSKPGD